jgi:hypothetical protein
MRNNTKPEIKSKELRAIAIPVLTTIRLLTSTVSPYMGVVAWSPMLTNDVYNISPKKRRLTRNAFARRFLSAIIANISKLYIAANETRGPPVAGRVS